MEIHRDLWWASQRLFAHTAKPGFIGCTIYDRDRVTVLLSAGDLLTFEMFEAYQELEGVKEALST